MKSKTNEKIKYPYIIIGLSVFIGFLLFADLNPEKPEITYTAAIAILMAIWWVSEAIPIGATSFLPLILFPLLGIMDGKAVANSYVNYIIFLFIGGFVMALAMEKWNLHRRIALKILTITGGKPFMILLGFMFASAFLSMWMSNTATAMMMLPIALSVIASLEETYEIKKIGKFNTGLLLSIAYACSIGGIATLVGTPPNLSFVRIFEIIFPQAEEISFGQWFIFALPISVLMFSIILLYLYIIFKPDRDIKQLHRSFFTDKYKQLGKITGDEIKVLIMFAILVLLWVFRTRIELGIITIPGWSELFENAKYINDGTIAMFIAVVLFIIPSSQKRQGLVTWDTLQNIPWRIVFLFGGGFALAKGFIDSGLSEYIGSQMAFAGELSEIYLISILSGVMSLLTEFTSNTATTEMMLPIMSGIAVEIQVNPLLLMIPVTLAASMAFMFPVATPPNAIVFGSGKIRMIEMLRTGFILNIIAVLTITIFTYFWGSYVFNLETGVFPDWAK